MRRVGSPRAAWQARLVVAFLAASLLAPAWQGQEALAAPKATSAVVDAALLAAAKASPTATFAVIIRGSTDLKTRDHGEVTRAAAAAQRAKGRPTHALGIVGSASATVTGAGILALAHDADVAAVTLDRAFRVSFDPVATAAAETTPGILEIGAPTAWTVSGATGQGVTVAVVDSGVYGHPDLGTRLIAAIDFTAAVPTVSTTPLGDPGGHGTHVAGLVAGDGTASGGAYTGVAPAADIVDVRVIGADGTTTLSTVLRGMQWVLQNRRTYNIRVANLSFGAPAQSSYTQDPLAAAAEELAFSGIVVVAAAGNGGPGAGTITTPATDPWVISVGAVDDNGTATTADDSLATFSAQGPTAYDGLAKPDLVAPGRRMVSLLSPGSTLDTTYPSREVTAPGASTAQYFMLSGTSMAAPIVAGTAALLLSEDPTLTPAQVRHRLLATADPVPFVAVNQTGAGMVDAAKAVASSDRAWASTGRRIADSFASQSYSSLYGQPLPWRDLSYNGGSDYGIPWGSVNWGDITWEDITWENLTWESFTWLDITWESVSTQSVTWETMTSLSVGSLSGTGSGWDLVD